MMAGMEVTAGADLPAPDTANSPSTTITGTVGIAGALSAILSFRCSAQCAAKIASRMLSVPIAEASPHQCDAIGEICNMAAGNFKAKIGLEDKCMLSVPSVITGGNYQLHAASATRRLELPAHLRRRSGVDCAGNSRLKLDRNKAFNGRRCHFAQSSE